MRRRESEPLALDQVEEADLSGVSMNSPSVPLADLPEAGAEWAGTIEYGGQTAGVPPSAAAAPVPEPDWRRVRAQRGRGHERGIER